MVCGGDDEDGLQVKLAPYTVIITRLPGAPQAELHHGVAVQAMAGVITGRCCWEVSPSLGGVSTL